MIPLSVLDLAMVPQGMTSGQALEQTTALAQVAETPWLLPDLGRRTSQHGHRRQHGASRADGTSGASTDRIKVGSGGVMLPNHAPLAIAEQFALLEALHPGRVDLGIGRAPGTDGATALALRRSREHLDAEDFPQNLLDLMGLLGDVRTEHGLWSNFKATPVAASNPAVHLLGSSGFSAQLSGLLGLPFAFAHHFDMGGTIEAVEIYRDSFEPSAILDEPYTMVTASTIAAPTADEAGWLAAPALLRRYGMRSGRVIPLMSPEQAAEHPSFPDAARMPVSTITGTATEVADGMRQLAERTGASELMTYTSTHALDHRIRSLELVAAEWGL